MRNSTFFQCQVIITLGGIILKMLEEINLGDKVHLRKAHPCGSYEWEVVRLGADIGLVCAKCQHRILLSRRELARRMKTIISRGVDAPAEYRSKT